MSLMSNRINDQQSMLESALSYAERGLKLIPLDGKAPAIVGGHGYLDATDDAGQIRDWWSIYPRANIGLAMRPNGMIALDIDPRNGGDKTLARLIEENGPLPDTVKQLSGGGGVHYVFGGNSRSIRSPGKGIDIVDPGYIVAAPSIHPETGQPYVWSTPLNIEGLADPPSWLRSASISSNHRTVQITLGQDPVFHALLRHGRVHTIHKQFADIRQAENGTEKVNIACPWMHQHTGKKDDGAAYFAGGGFKCHHAHCAGRNIQDLLRYLAEQGEDVEQLRRQQQQAIANARNMAMSKSIDALLAAAPVSSLFRGR